MNISFIGLGKLGLPLASCLANIGHKVLGVDKNDIVLDKLTNGVLPFFEPDLKETFVNAAHNFIDFTDSYKRAIDEADVSIILVNTQLGDYGYSSEFVEAVISDLAIHLKKSDKNYHTIVLSSTVLPGESKRLIRIIENISGRKYQEGFGFAFVPDFVRLGCVIKDFKNPDFFLVGANNERDAKTATDIWKHIFENDPRLYHLTLEEAEIAKVSLNAYIVNKISFSNFLGNLCDGLDNVDVHNITDVIGQDKRIAPHFFRSGTPYGGTCFPRDTAAFIKFANDRHYQAKNLMFCDEVNNQLYDRLLDKSDDYDHVGILGVSFKPASPVTVASPSVRLINNLLQNGKTVHIFDKLSESYEIMNIVSNDLITYSDPQLCINNSQCVYLMHFDKTFKPLDYTNKALIDLWGCVR